jgi:hypothetical protein
VTDSPTPPVPPNSTALRELAHVVEKSLTLPRPATTGDELVYLRIVRDRARLVRLAMRRLLADHEADDGDVMVMVAALRGEVGQLGDDACDHAPEPS